MLPPKPRPGRLLDSFGYGHAVQWQDERFGVRRRPWGGVGPRVPLVAGTAMTGLQRAMAVAGSANGIGLSIPLDRCLSRPAP